MGEEVGNLFFGRIVWVALTVKQDEASNPVEICLLGADAVAPPPHERTDVIQPFGLARRVNVRFNGHAKKRLSLKPPTRIPPRAGANAGQSQTRTDPLNNRSGLSLQTRSVCAIGPATFLAHADHC